MALSHAGYTLFRNIGIFRVIPVYKGFSQSFFEKFIGFILPGGVSFVNFELLLSRTSSKAVGPKIANSSNFGGFVRGRAFIVGMKLRRRPGAGPRILVGSHICGYNKI